MVYGLDNRTQDIIATLVGDALAAANPHQDKGVQLARAWKVALSHAHCLGLLSRDETGAVVRAFDGLDAAVCHAYNL